jgi:hypothetical protein
LKFFILRPWRPSSISLSSSQIAVSAFGSGGS